MIDMLIIFLCLSSMVISVIKEKNFYNPIVIFSGLWGVIFLLYLFNPYDLPDVKDETLLLFLLGILFYLLGNYTCRDKSKIHHKSRVLYIDNFNNKNLILIIQLVGSAVGAYLGSFGLAAILSGQDLTFIRYTLMELTLKNSINGPLHVYVLTPIMYFSITYTCAQIAANNFKKSIKLSVFFSLFMMVMELLTTGGRMGMFYTIICVAVAFLINRKTKESKGIKKSSLIPIVIFALLGLFAIWKMADNRGGKGTEDLAVYLYGSIPCFDINKDIFDQPRYHNTYGFLSFQGFLRPIMKVLMLSDTQIMKNIDDVSDMIDEPVDLSGRDFNSEVTMFGYFYFDGGLFFVILMSYLMGCLCQRIYRSFIYSSMMDLSFMFLYLIIIGNIALSFLHFSFASVGFALSIPLMYILKTPKKNGSTGFSVS